MKRNMDLVRLVLKRVEDLDTSSGWEPLSIDGFSAEEISYHVMLLNEAGLLVARDLGQFEWYPGRLTWAGHDFLDAARSDTFWNRAKALIKDNAGTVSFDVLKEVLVMFAKQSLGTPG